ncbi:MAG: DNA-3-methyladenine glycosylase I [Candidatus Moranbacteria bacterium]|jgi:DNA-3-methyladenine glycosylase I|nr:DNA-3-methyladenine glycosylase I [Candidatus Moranbacteria bacterium]
MAQKQEKKRCAWVRPGNNLYEQYHDTEWGVRTYDDRRLFEFLLLESAQAGLSWETILKKRSAYREAFAHFDPEKISRFGRRDIERLMKNSGIIRNRLKIESAISNARLFLELQKEYGSFANYLRQFVTGESNSGKRRTQDQVPILTAEAETLASDLKRRGFKFFGPIIGYAYMQAIGMVNDHTTLCFRYHEIEELNKKKPARG